MEEVREENYLLSLSFRNTSAISAGKEGDQTNLSFSSITGQK